jgi:hypothetical protein
VNGIRGFIQIGASVGEKHVFDRNRWNIQEKCFSLKTFCSFIQIHSFAASISKRREFQAPPEVRQDSRKIAKGKQKKQQ